MIKSLIKSLNYKIKTIRDIFNLRKTIRNSYFKTPKFKIRIGLVRKGIPYFLPNKWFSFDVKNLGYKIKYDIDDFRYEHNPFISITCLGLQCHISLVSPIEYANEYWENWLKYDIFCDNKSIVSLWNFLEKIPDIIVYKTREKKEIINISKLLIKNEYV